MLSGTGEIEDELMCWISWPLARAVLTRGVLATMLSNGYPAIVKHMYEFLWTIRSLGLNINQDRLTSCLGSEEDGR